MTVFINHRPRSPDDACTQSHRNIPLSIMAFCPVSRFSCIARRWMTSCMRRLRVSHRDCSGGSFVSMAGLMGMGSFSCNHCDNMNVSSLGCIQESGTGTTSFDGVVSPVGRLIIRSIVSMVLLANVMKEGLRCLIWPSVYMDSVSHHPFVYATGEYSMLKILILYTRRSCPRHRT
jgi:hypothetical protein